MQTSEHLIAYQTVSFAAYQRLKETLVQQSHVFETVIVDTYPVEHVVQSAVANTNAAGTQQLKNDVFTASHGVEDYVMMASAKLKVLLTATPIVSETTRESPHQASAWTNNHPAARTDKSSAEKPTRSSSAHLLAAHLSTHNLSAQASRPEWDAETTPSHYRVGLTFDDRAIAVFIDRLQGRPEPVDPVGPATDSTSPDPHPTSSPSTSSSSISALQSKGRSMAQDISDGERIIAQKSFVLAWAKNLATSPEGDAQPTQETLDNQLQQSLLLDQVITRIRRSLDLSAILETTVAQVREFLSADRLVLYQFDQFDAAKSAPMAVSEEESLSGKLASALENLSSGVLSFDKEGKQHGQPAVKRSAVDAQQQHSVCGQSSHAGHVTYESRADESISSVLHIAENECFKPSLSMRSRYLQGRPIAVDNVDEQYGSVACLLNFLKQAQVKSKIIAPIIVQDNLWGLLIAHQCQDYRHWEDTEAIFLQHIAEHLAVAISQASLYQQLRQQTVSLESCVIERTQSLHDALMAAESANITKGEFLSTMSHELRTPLTYIIGMSATLLRWSFGELNERQRSYLNTINHSGEQLLGVINNILEFASIESGQSLLDLSEFSISQLMRTLVSRHQEMAEAKVVTLTLNCSVGADEDMFYADAKRLQQILSNLLHNAVKFTSEGGEVIVRVWREPKSTIFQIEDTGIGIPESQQDELFETFKQLEPPIHRQYSGTGLGLAMTKRLVELHGGSIQVDSQVGKGSTFTVRLPVHDEMMSIRHYQVPAAEASAKRIILLETDEENSAIICEMLTAAGYEVIWLVDADDLAKQLELLQPVLLIADLSLIHADVSSVKATQLSITALDAKVLALADPSDSAPSSVAHHDTLHKPIEPKTLLEKVRRLLVAVS